MLKTMLCPKAKEEFKHLSKVYGDNIAYAVFSKNGGLTLKKTPDGLESITYKQLEKFGRYFKEKGIIDQEPWLFALEQKAQIYSQGFAARYGNWLSPMFRIDYGDSLVNGEPKIEVTYVNSDGFGVVEFPVYRSPVTGKTYPAVNPIGKYGSIKQLAENIQGSIKFAPSVQSYQENIKDVMIRVLGEKTAKEIISKNGGHLIDSAPNGKTSKLFYDIVRFLIDIEDMPYDKAFEEAVRLKSLIYTRKFKDWFGDWQNNDFGVFTDDNGEPKLYFHGTKRYFEAFSSEFFYSGEGSMVHGAGFYFTDNFNTAKGYARISDKEKRTGVVFPVYLKPVKLINSNKEQNTVLADILKIRKNTSRLNTVEKDLPYINKSDFDIVRDLIRVIKEDGNVDNVFTSRKNVMIAFGDLYQITKLLSSEVSGISLEYFLEYNDVVEGLYDPSKDDVVSVVGRAQSKLFSNFVSYNDINKLKVFIDTAGYIIENYDQVMELIDESDDIDDRTKEVFKDNVNKILEIYKTSDSLNVKILFFSDAITEKIYDLMREFGIVDDLDGAYSGVDYKSILIKKKEVVSAFTYGLLTAAEFDRKDEAFKDFDNIDEYKKYLILSKYYKDFRRLKKENKAGFIEDLISGINTYLSDNILGIYTAYSPKKDMIINANKLIEGVQKIFDTIYNEEDDLSRSKDLTVNSSMINSALNKNEPTIRTIVNYLRGYDGVHHVTYGNNLHKKNENHIVAFIPRYIKSALTPSMAKEQLKLEQEKLLTFKKDEDTVWYAPVDFDRYIYEKLQDISDEAIKAIQEAVLDKDINNRINRINNGQSILRAPNGKRSKLFNTIVEAYTKINLDIDSKDKFDEQFDKILKETVKIKSVIYRDEFINWFGKWYDPSFIINNKVDYLKDRISPSIDENGEPRLFFHGTRAFFKMFDPKFFRAGEGAMIHGAGFYFTNIPDTSIMYAYRALSDTGSTVFPVFLKTHKTVSSKVADDVKTFSYKLNDKSKIVPSRIVKGKEIFGLKDETVKAIEEFYNDNESRTVDIDKNTAFTLYMVKNNMLNHIRIFSVLLNIRTLWDAMDDELRKVFVENLSLYDYKYSKFDTIDDILNTVERNAKNEVGYDEDLKKLFIDNLKETKDTYLIANGAYSFHLVYKDIAKALDEVVFSAETKSDSIADKEKSEKYLKISQEAYAIKLYIKNLYNYSKIPLLGFEAIRDFVANIADIKDDAEPIFEIIREAFDVGITSEEFAENAKGILFENSYNDAFMAESRDGTEDAIFNFLVSITTGYGTTDFNYRDNKTEVIFAATLLSILSTNIALGEITEVKKIDIESLPLFGDERKIASKINKGIELFNERIKSIINSYEAKVTNYRKEFVDDILNTAHNYVKSELATNTTASAQYYLEKYNVYSKEDKRKLESYIAYLLGYDGITHITFGGLGHRKGEIHNIVFENENIKAAYTPESAIKEAKLEKTKLQTFDKNEKTVWYAPSDYGYVSDTIDSMFEYYKRNIDEIVKYANNYIINKYGKEEFDRLIEENSGYSLNKSYIGKSSSIFINSFLYGFIISARDILKEQLHIVNKYGEFTDNAIKKHRILDKVNKAIEYAVEAKRNIFSEEFINWFGDWKNDKQIKNAYVKKDGRIYNPLLSRSMEPRLYFHGSFKFIDFFDPKFFRAGEGAMIHGAGWYHTNRLKTAVHYSLYASANRDTELLSIVPVFIRSRPYIMSNEINHIADTGNILKIKSEDVISRVDRAAELFNIDERIADLIKDAFSEENVLSGIESYFVLANKVNILNNTVWNRMLLSDKFTDILIYFTDHFDRIREAFDYLIADVYSHEYITEEEKNKLVEETVDKVAAKLDNIENTLKSYKNIDKTDKSVIARIKGNIKNDIEEIMVILISNKYGISNEIYKRASLITGDNSVEATIDYLTEIASTSEDEELRSYIDWIKDEVGIITMLSYITDIVYDDIAASDIFSEIISADEEIDIVKSDVFAEFINLANYMFESLTYAINGDKNYDYRNILLDIAELSNRFYVMYDKVLGDIFAEKYLSGKYKDLTYDDFVETVTYLVTGNITDFDHAFMYDYISDNVRIAKRFIDFLFDDVYSLYYDANYDNESSVLRVNKNTLFHGSINMKELSVLEATYVANTSIANAKISNGKAKIKKGEVDVDDYKLSIINRLRENINDVLVDDYYKIMVKANSNEMTDFVTKSMTSISDYSRKKDYDFYKDIIKVYDENISKVSVFNEIKDTEIRKSFIAYLNGYNAIYHITYGGSHHRKGESHFIPFDTRDIKSAFVPVEAIEELKLNKEKLNTYDDSEKTIWYAPTEEIMSYSYEHVDEVYNKSVEDYNYDVKNYIKKKFSKFVQSNKKVADIISKYYGHSKAHKYPVTSNKLFIDFYTFRYLENYFMNLGKTPKQIAYQALNDFLVIFSDDFIKWYGKWYTNDYRGYEQYTIIDGKKVQKNAYKDKYGPKIYFHGTNAVYSELDFSKIGSGVGDELYEYYGFYYVDNVKTAYKYGLYVSGKKRSIVFPVFLKPNKVMRYTFNNQMDYVFRNRDNFDETRLLNYLDANHNNVFIAEVMKAKNILLTGTRKELNTYVNSLDNDKRIFVITTLAYSVGFDAVMRIRVKPSSVHDSGDVVMTVFDDKRVVKSAATPEIIKQKLGEEDTRTYKIEDKNIWYAPADISFSQDDYNKALQIMLKC